MSLIEQDVKYPIFLRDRAGVVYQFQSESDFIFKVSPIEIELGEFRGWDREGYRLSLTVGDESPSAARLTGKLEMEQLLVAILEYPKIRTGNSYSQKSANKDPVTLFHAVERFIECNPASFWWKLFD